MKDFEKPGFLYLGKCIDPQTGKCEDSPFLYESKNLTTHAVCVGMTGSGKTGLGIVLLEEVGLDKIPAIVIDPKGDLGNLLLTFPKLTPEEFKPWIDPTVAASKGLDATAYAQEMADLWKKGLSEWGEDAERIDKFRKSVNLKIYTPASKSGIPLSILNSFKAPPKDDFDDPDILRDRILSTTSSLLGLLGITADPLKSREHILISTLIDQAWKNEKNLDIADLIKQVQKPPFTKIGALDIDTFYPQKERMELSIRLNNLLASPGFKAWMEGEPLDIKRLLYTPEGKPNIAIISIAHLSDSERMFFVTLLLNEFINWMRRQEGTSSLRAVLYMDEIFGFFPPIATPPSKLPMITLLKTARAFGVGIILVTQNPVDLDYKGLSNCGTWFIGKLQTDRDKARVIEGLKGASVADIDAKELDQKIKATGNRIFMMRSVYLKNIILFQTRWTMSYLSGPMTLAQIAKLTDRSEIKVPTSVPIKNADSLETKPDVPSNVEEFFYNKGAHSLHYEPLMLALGKLHYVDIKNKVDVWEDVCFTFKPDGENINWDEGKNDLELKRNLEKSPLAESTFAPIPDCLAQEKNYPGFQKAFAQSLYQNQVYTLFLAPSLKLVSKPNETEGDFRVRIQEKQREERDPLIQKIKDKYESKISVWTAKLKRAQEKMSDKKQKMWQQMFQTGISACVAVLGAFLGKGVTKGTISETGTTLQRASRIGQNQKQATSASEDAAACQEQLDALNSAMNSEIAAINPDTINIETITIHPRKTDVTVEKIAILWRS